MPGRWLRSRWSILEMPRNKTTEHIDMQALYDHVKTALIQSGQFTFLDKGARQEIAEEYEYQGSGYVREDEAQGPGNQRAARFLLGGVITSTLQQVGKNKVVYYKATFELTDISTTEIGLDRPEGNHQALPEKEHRLLGKGARSMRHIALIALLALAVGAQAATPGRTDGPEGSEYGKGGYHYKAQYGRFYTEGFLGAAI